MFHVYNYLNVVVSSCATTPYWLTDKYTLKVTLYINSAQNMNMYIF